MGDCDLAGHECFVVLVGVEGGDARLGVGDEIGRLTKVVDVGVVERVPQILERSTHRLARVVQHRHTTGEAGREVWIEDERPARLEVLADDRLVHTETRRPVLIRHRVGTLRVIRESLEVLSQVRVVRDGVLVQLDQQTLVDHDPDHVVGRHDEVVRHAGLDLGQHRLVRLVERLDDVDVVLLLERGDQLGVDVLRPVVEVEIAIGATDLAVGRADRIVAATRRRHEGERREQQQRLS